LIGNSGMEKSKWLTLIHARLMPRISNRDKDGHQDYTSRCTTITVNLLIQSFSTYSQEQHQRQVPNWKFKPVVIYLFPKFYRKITKTHYSKLAHRPKQWRYLFPNSYRKLPKPITLNGRTNPNNGVIFSLIPT
jgi:hypothetical protein